MNLAQLYGYPSMADNEMGPGLGYRGQQLMARLHPSMGIHPQMSGGYAPMPAMNPQMSGGLPPQQMHRGRMLQMLGSRNFNDFGFHRYA